MSNPASPAVQVTENGRLIQTALLNPGPQAGPVRLRAVAGARYVLTDLPDDEGAPVTAARGGDDLVIASPEGAPLAVIEGWYAAHGALAVADAAGGMHAYGAAPGEPAPAGPWPRAASPGG